MNPDQNTDGQYLQMKRFKKYYTQLEPVWEKPKNRMYTAIIFSFLAISLFGYFAILPTIKTILYLQKEITDKTEVNNKMEQKIADLIQARSLLDQIQTQLPLIREAIPENPEGLDLMLQLRNLTNTTEASLSSLSVSSIPLTTQDTTTKLTKSTDTKFAVNGLLIGGFSGLESFLEKVFNLRRIVIVDKINFSQTESSSVNTPESGQTIRLSINLESYYK